MGEKWQGWDLDNPPVPEAFATARGWEIPLKGSDPALELTEVIVTIGELSSRDVVAPIITLVSSPEDATALITGEIVNIEVLFDELVDVTGVPQIPVFANDGTTPLNGNTGLADYVSGTGTNKLVFQYTVDVLDSEATGMVIGADIALNGGTIQDVTLANATLTFTQVTTTITLN